MIPLPLYRAPAICAVAVLLATSAHAATVYVDDDAPFGGDGATWNAAYRFLSDGLAAAAPGDIIKVAAGTHRPDESAASPDGSGDITLFFTLEDGQKLRGGYAGFGAPNPDERDLDLYPTILSGDLDDDDEPGFINRDDNALVVVDLGDRIDVILNGLTIRGGHEDSEFVDGGGVRMAFGMVTIKRCRIFDNFAEGRGAGVFALTSDIEIEDCEFRGNRSESTGGGIRVQADSALVLRNCSFDDNVADVGAAFNASDGGTVLAVDCVVKGNLAIVGGGGATLTSQDSVRLFRCRFDRNIANTTGGVAGGLLASATEITIKDSVFTSNFCTFAGGGLFVDGEQATITNCLFSRNTSDRGAGAFNSKMAHFVNCSFSRNEGNGLRTESTGSLSIVENSIFWNSTAAQIFGHTTVTYSCIEGGHSGAGNIDDDPVFVQAGTDNLRLAAGSPCLDMGNNDAVPNGVTVDLDGNPRFANGTVDMGCYEGVFTAMPEAASLNDLDKGEVAILPIAGVGWDPLHQSTLIVVNRTGEDDASLVATILDQLGPVPGGFSVNGAVIQIETEGMSDGEFWLQIYAPIDPAQLNGVDPRRLDITRLHETGFWALGVSANTVSSPGTFGQIGDRIAAFGPEPAGASGELGDYGLWWDADAEEGLAWSNVDRQGTYALGVPLHPADCLQPPNDFVDFHDLLFVIGYWGAGAGPFDVDDSGEVGLPDLVEVLSHWGACP